MLWDYSELHSHIVNRELRTYGLMVHQIVGSAMGDKKAARMLRDTFKTLSD